MVFQKTIKLASQEKGATDITDLISSIIKESSISTGICQLFAHSSQSSLLIYDTADEDTKSQTEDFLAQLAPSNDNTSNTLDDSMDAVPEGMRDAIIQTSVTFPINKTRPVLGVWQGIYLWERTTQPKQRKLTITVVGE